MATAHLFLFMRWTPTQKVDLSTRREEEEETKANDVDDETLVATGGFDFGD